MLKTSKDLQAQFAALRKSLDRRITEPTGVPQPLKGPDGKYRHISDTEKLDGKGYGAIHNQLGLDVANLGTLYALSGEARYAEYAKKILLDYADAFPNYVVGARPGFSHAPSSVFDQTLGDATWLIPVAKGYDLIHDYPNLSPQERRHIEDDLLKADARLLTNHTMLESPTNWSAIAVCAVLTTGYATDDAELVRLATNGTRPVVKDKVTGGYFFHFGEKTIG